MKKLHQDTFYCWSVFQELQNIDFHGFLWRRPEGNIIIDPMPMSEHNKQHLEALGGAPFIVITNSDHVRDAISLAQHFNSQIWGPFAEKESFPIPCEHWLKKGSSDFKGMQIFEMHGSKTKGELALIVNETTLITGDLIRSHEGGKLCLLPDAKLKDKNLAIQSVKQFGSMKKIKAVLTGDGWPVFRDGARVLEELILSL